MGGWPAILGTLSARRDLTAEQARAAMAEILDGAATPAQIAGFIVALRMKGETVDELGGLVDAMLAAAERVTLPPDEHVVDIVGTGGDRAHTINVSTLSALVVAGAGGRRVQARQPGGLVGDRFGRPAGGARGADRLRSRGGGPLRGPGRHRLLLRAAVPPRDAPRRTAAARARHRHRLQLPGPAGQPGGRPPAR